MKPFLLFNRPTEKGNGNQAVMLRVSEIISITQVMPGVAAHDQGGRTVIKTRKGDQHLAKEPMEVIRDLLADAQPRKK